MDATASETDDGATAWYTVAVEAQAGGAWRRDSGEPEGTLSNAYATMSCTLHGLCSISPLSHV